MSDTAGGTTGGATAGAVPSDDEGVLDPYVARWFEEHPMLGRPTEKLTPELLSLARSPIGPPPTREIAEVADHEVEGIKTRWYQHGGPPTGLLVYFHGGGFCLGSIAIMDNVARELAHHTGAAVVSVEYRLAPEHPYPAGLDDCETVTRWALANAERFATTVDRVVVGGESAGGNLSAAVAMRLRDRGGPPVAGQMLLYPGVAGSGGPYPSRAQFDGLVLNVASKEAYWSAYSGGRDLDAEPYAAPVRVADLSGLPPALVVLGGCDVLRDEGRHYAARLREAGVTVDEVCVAGQPHGFLNFGWPAAALTYQRIGAWFRTLLPGR